MRVKLSRPQTYVPEFNDNKSLPAGEQISADLSPLDMKDFLDLADYLQRVGRGRQVLDSKDLSVGDMKDLLTDGGRFLPKYVVLKGLVNEDTNEPVTVNDVSALPAFIPLSVELLIQLAAVSSPNEADVKN